MPLDTLSTSARSELAAVKAGTHLRSDYTRITQSKALDLWQKSWAFW